jgi:hypothetical protein
MPPVPLHVPFVPLWSCREVLLLNLVPVPVIDSLHPLFYFYFQTLQMDPNDVPDNYLQYLIKLGLILTILQSWQQWFPPQNIYSPKESKSNDIKT